MERANCRQNTHCRLFRSICPYSTDSLKGTDCDDRLCAVVGGGNGGLTNGVPESIFVQLGRVVLTIDAGHGRRLRGAERKAGGAEEDDEGEQRDGQRRHRRWKQQAVRYNKS